MTKSDIELILRAAAREYLGLKDGEYFDSGLPAHQAKKLWFILEEPLEKAWVYDGLCD